MRTYLTFRQISFTYFNFLQFIIYCIKKQTQKMNTQFLYTEDERVSSVFVGGFRKTSLKKRICVFKVEMGLRSRRQSIVWRQGTTVHIPSFPNQYTKKLIAQAVWSHRSERQKMEPKQSWFHGKKVLPYPTHLRKRIKCRALWTQGQQHVCTKKKWLSRSWACMLV